MGEDLEEELEGTEFGENWAKSRREKRTPFVIFSKVHLTIWQLSIKYLLGGKAPINQDNETSVLCVSHIGCKCYTLRVSLSYLTFHLPAQVSVCWQVAQCSYPALPCWSQAVCWSVLFTCQTLAPTSAWRATRVALTRPLPTCWCGVSEITGKGKESSVYCWIPNNNIAL